MKNVTKNVKFWIISILADYADGAASKACTNIINARVTLCLKFCYVFTPKQLKNFNEFWYSDRLDLRGYGLPILVKIILKGIQIGWKSAWYLTTDFHLECSS